MAKPVSRRISYWSMKSRGASAKSRRAIRQLRGRRPILRKRHHNRVKDYFGYIRVSTAKQGTHGVSLVEQKGAIERYASKHGLTIAEWFEERETAAKRGRPVFSRMLTALRKKHARGVIIHKIDRSARNLKDWADLQELIDTGVDAHFAADALDLASRGGRLSADIQAVVAADYIRNLREETKKGFYGRLKQGLYPLGAPLGYRDEGGGKAKTIDPVVGPLVRLAFDLYATRRYSLQSLRDELHERGLRKKSGRPLAVSSLSYLLNNPFYAGLIYIAKTRETFIGIHEPLVPRETFDRVQGVLKGRLVPKVAHHDYLFRRLLTCGLCSSCLVGERQKGNVYYRCHKTGCATKTIRESFIEEALLELFEQIEIAPAEAEEGRRFAEANALKKMADRQQIEAGTRLAVANLKGRLDRLTDAFVDGAVEKSLFDERRASLLVELARKEGDIGRVSEIVERERMHELRRLELLESLVLSYKTADQRQKREIIENVTSNRIVRGRTLEIATRNGFDALAERHSFQSGPPVRNATRTS